MASNKLQRRHGALGRVQQGRSAPAAASFKFGKLNVVLALSGLAAISVGYYLLDQGSITLAPILLVVGYVVLLPLAIIA